MDRGERRFLALADINGIVGTFGQQFAEFAVATPQLHFVDRETLQATPTPFADDAPAKLFTFGILEPRLFRDGLPRTVAIRVPPPLNFYNT